MRIDGPREDEERSRGDEARFLRTLLQSPRLTGAVAPSGRMLARAMAAATGPLRSGLVVELGPGTGPVTRALVERGIARERLVLVEYDPSFCRALAQRYAPARVVHGDAYDLMGALREIADQPIAAIVSSLPLLNQPPHLRAKLIDDAFALMGADGVFVQFTYGLVSPAPRETSAGRYAAHCGAPVWRNLPPARVWTYRIEKSGRRVEPVIARLKRNADRLGKDLAQKSRKARAGLVRQRDLLRERLARHAERALKNGKRKVVVAAMRARRPLKDR